MARYQVQWNYKSGYGGPWEKGQEIEVDPLDAERINIDSPGVLVPTDELPKKLEPKTQGPDTKEPATGNRDLEAPPHDRQIKRPTGRR